MLELGKVDRALFEGFVDQDFEIALKDATLKVRLVEVRLTGARHEREIANRSR
jgi:hypothetical protein